MYKKIKYWFIRNWHVLIRSWKIARFLSNYDHLELGDTFIFNDGTISEAYFVYIGNGYYLWTT